MRTEKNKRIALLAALLAFAGTAAASEAPGGVIEQAHNDITNVASLQRGARNFVNYCQGCHSARYVRYSRLGADLGLSEQQVIENLMFTGERIHDTMRDHYASRGRSTLVRHHAARPVADRPQPWHGLHLFLPEVVLPGSQPADRRQQPGAARYGDAARACGSGRVCRKPCTTARAMPNITRSTNASRSSGWSDPAARRRRSSINSCAIL